MNWSAVNRSASCKDMLRCLLYIILEHEEVYSATALRGSRCGIWGRCFVEYLRLELLLGLVEWRSFSGEEGRSGAEEDKYGEGIYDEGEVENVVVDPGAGATPERTWW